MMQRFFKFFLVAALSAPVSVLAQEDTEDKASTAETAQASADVKKEATPAKDGADDCPEGLTPAQRLQMCSDGPKKNWTLVGRISHSFGTGNFVKNDNLREQADLVLQGYTVGGNYRFKVADHTITAQGVYRFSYQLTAPQANPARRFNSGTVALSAFDAAVYKEEITGITFNAGVGLSMPTQRGGLPSQFTTERPWLSLSANGGALRQVGPVTLSYTLGLNKFLQPSKVPQVRTDNNILRDGDPGVTGNTESTSRIASGYANTNWTMSHTASATYQIVPTFMANYSLTYTQMFPFELYSEADEFTPTNGDPGVNVSDMFTYSVSGVYLLSQALKDVVELPVQLNLSAGFMALHGTRSADNEDILWPAFYPAFGQDRAALNLGVAFVSLTGIY